MIGASEIADAVRCNQLSNRRSSPGTGGGHLPFVEPNRFKNICMDHNLFSNVTTYFKFLNAQRQPFSYAADL